MSDLCAFDPKSLTTAPHQTEGWILFRESPERVFARVADHAAMGEWLPLVQDIRVSHPAPVAPGQSMIGTTRTITLKGGLSVTEEGVYWNPPYCYAYSSRGKLFPLKNYIGLCLVEPLDDTSGKLILREYFDELGPLPQAIVPHGVVAVFHQALGNLARLIGGTEYAMTAVSRI